MAIAAIAPAVALGLQALGLFRKTKDSLPMSPEIQDLLRLQAQRYSQQQPLYESIARLAYARLPPAARAGLSTPSLDQAEQEVPAVGSYAGQYAEPPIIRELLRMQQVRSRLTDPIRAAIRLMAGRRLPRGFTPREPGPPPGFAVPRETPDKPTPDDRFREEAESWR